MKTKKFRSKKSLQKRIKILAKGSLKCHHAGNAHLASHKTNQQKKRLQKSFLLSRSDTRRLKKMIGAKITKKNINNLPKITPETETLPI
ncbi:MAG: 50S ribosomal protein L35 [Candidatus Moeniiplasma glomeromycotorum]|nr:50S ribosomal protein L35 [Candidatus Moeniiplasma glomeromycotorum]MCE8167472.1 50S ribosomal protein L35 [Candidatus Moeniiplasma glomeromycotorum]MCE8168514.1 50S ribosomal protein L35 [Candidatus Moeniiplasma glomeromycotorum]